MRRRSFLLLSFGLLGAAAALGIGYEGTEMEIASLVRKRLGSLKLDEAGLKAFAHDQVAWYLAKRPTWGHIKRHLHAGVAPPALGRVFRSAVYPTRRQRLADSYASQYLLSSDFFFQGANESRVVQYIGFYDPLTRPCLNPFARPPNGV